MSKKVITFFTAFFVIINVFFGNFPILNAESASNATTTSENATNNSKQSTENVENIVQEEKTSEVQPHAATDIKVSLSGISFTSDGNSSEIDESLDILSGSQVLVRTTFGVSAAGTIEANQLMFRAELPANSGFIAAPSDLVDYRNGGPGGPDDATIVPGKEYVWIIYKQGMEPGAGKSFSFYINPSKNGTTPNGTRYDVNLQAYDGATMLPIANANSSNHINAKVPTFNWNTVSTSLGGSVFDSQGDVAVPTITVKYNTTPQYASGDNGIAYAKEINFKDSYEVPCAADGTPLLQITGANLFHADGTAMVAGVDYTIDASNGGYITKFTVLHKNENTDLTAEIAQKDFTFKIQSATLDASKIIAEYGLAANQTSTYFYLKSVGSTHTVTPSVAIEDTGLAAKDLAQNANPSIRFSFKNTLETGNETDEKNKFQKSITRIGVTGTTGTANDKLAAYPNDLIVYQIGANFKNYQKNALDSLTFTETAGTGYDATEMAPQKITTGAYFVGNDAPTTASLTITISFGSNPPITRTISGDDLKTSKTINIPANIAEDVTNIEYKFTNVDSQFVVKTAPTMTFKTLKQVDETKSGSKFNNKATMEYKYTNQDFGGTLITKSQDASAYYYYKEKETNIDGRFESNKTARNLTKSGYPDQNNVLLFEVTIKNIEDSPWNIKNIKDLYTYNLSPYNQSTIVPNDSEATPIDSQYLASNITNMVVWDPADSSQIYSDQSILSVTDTAAVAPGRGTLDINFSGSGIVVQPGQTLKLTYTMYTDTDFVKGQTLGNSYTAYNDTGKPKAIGEFWWSENNTALTDRNRNKTWQNTSGGVLNEAPFPDDVLTFTLQMKNESGQDWTDPLVITDTYDSYLLPIGGPTYGGLTDINADYPSYDNLDPTKELNLGVLSAPAGFDASQISVTLDEASNQFYVNLGSNKILDGEEVKLIYTMQVRADIVSQQKLVNRFTLKNGPIDVLTGRCELTANQFIAKAGIVSVVKSVNPIANADGTMPNTTRLIEGEKVKYTVDMTNYRNRPVQKVHVKNFEDFLPDNIKYIDNSTKVYLVEYDGKNNVVSKQELAEGTDFTVNYPFAADSENNDNQLSIKLNSAQELKGREYVANSLKKYWKIIVEYDGVVDLESDDFPEINSPNRTVDRINVVDAFFVEHPNQIANYKSGGVITEDTSDIDNDVTTQAIIDSAAKVSVANNKIIFGNITKQATTNKILNVDLTDDSRVYEITLHNYSVTSMPVQKVVDILPRFEKLDTTTPIMLQTSTGTFEAIYTLGTFIDANGVDLERIIITGYKDDSGVTQPIDIERTNNISTPMQYKIKYTTKVNTVAAKTLMQKDDKDTLSYHNYVAAYFDSNVTFTVTGSPAAGKVTTDDVGNDDWDGDATTAVRYQNSDAVSLTSNYTSPFVNVKGQKVFVNSSGTQETYQDYVPGVTTANPGDVIAWKMNFGNSNQTNTKSIKAGTKLVAVLSPGATYQGYSWNSSGTEVIPTFVDAPTITQDADGNTIIVWEVNSDLPKNTDLSFTIRTATENNVYKTYVAKTYLVPSDATDQYFYDNTIATSSEYVKYSYKSEWKDIRNLLSDTDELSHYVVSQAYMDVYGDLGISSLFQVTDTTTQATPATITSRDTGQRIMELTSRDDMVRYGMRLNVEKASKGFTDPVFINRLPSKNDNYSQDNKPRGSEADVRLVSDGSFTAEILNNQTNAVIRTLTPDVDYVIEYFFGSANETFTIADWQGATDATRWLNSTDVTASGLSFEDATAIRFRPLTTGYTVAKGESLFVSYNALLDNYQVGGKEALNSFGYSGRIGVSTFVNAEPLYVGIKAPLLKDRVVVEKILLDKNTTPKMDTFTMDLVGKDSSDVEQYRKSLSIQTTDFVDTDSDGINDTWKGQKNVYELPLGLTYSLEEPAITDYKAPVYQATSTLNRDGTTEWHLSVTNEPIYYADVTITKILNEDIATPTATSFVIDLVGKDTSGNEISRTPYTLNLTQNGTVWEGSVTVTKLDVSLDYSVEEHQSVHYTPTYTINQQNVAYGKSWSLLVTNDTNYEDTATIKKILHEDTDTPTRQTFTVDLVGKNASGNEVSRTPYTLNLTKNGAVWESQAETITGLVHGITYSVEEQDTAHYTVAYNEASQAIQYGTAWSFEVENTPILEDEVTIKKVLYEDTGIPLKTNFVIDLVAKDATGAEVSRTPQTLDVKRNGAIWEASKTITGLQHGLTYSVEEQDASRYNVNYKEDHNLIQYGTAWSFEVENTPIVDGEITIKKVLHENTASPTRTSFVIDLIAKDAAGTEVSRTPYTLNLTRNGVVWEASTTITDVDMNLVYSVEEQDNSAYWVEYTETNNTTIYTKSWNFQVDNTLKDNADKLKQTGEQKDIVLLFSTLLLALSLVCFALIKRVRLLMDTTQQ